MSQHSTLSLSDGQHIAYHRFIPPEKGNKRGIIFLGGFRSDMEGTKALFLDRYCREHHIPFIRFDYFGHGQSSGTFEEGTIGRWKDDVIAVLDALVEEPQILVGSSMGGWLMLLAALERPEKISALVGVAAAPDFTETLMWDAFNEEQKRTVMEEGVYHLPTNYCNAPSSPEECYPITRILIEEARHHLLLGGPIPIHCPVRLLHGMQDEDVPYRVSIELAEKLETPDVEIHLQKQGDHRMSTPESLEQLVHILEGVV